MSQAAALGLARAAGDRLPAGLLEHLVEVRRALHRHPELSNQEVETTGRLRDELGAAGVEGVRALGPTGLVVDIAGERPGPTVVVRGDMDALPLHERTELPFRSEVPGVMHACGHDVHSTIALGVALTAAQRRAEIPGTLRVIFQPAEEAEPLGGREVVANGHLDGVAAAVALHVDPDTPTGRVSLRSGPSMASSDEFSITVHGASSHAGWPHLGSDAVSAAAAVIQAVQQAVSRRIDPIKPATVNLARIEGGSATNIVAERVCIHGTLRTLDEGVRATLRTMLADVAAHAAAACGARAEVEIVEGEPSVDNDPRVIDAFAATAERLLGPGACRRLGEPTMIAEDFAFYTHEVPAAIVWLGVRDEGRGYVHALHDPRFAADEAAIPLGVELLLHTAISLLEDPPRP